jgi:DNA-directed RNA polymerase II subunit RPB1
MSDFLTRFTERTLGHAPVLEPLALRFVRSTLSLGPVRDDRRLLVEPPVRHRALGRAVFSLPRDEAEAPDAGLDPAPATTPGPTSRPISRPTSRSAASPGEQPGDEPGALAATGMDAPRPEPEFRVFRQLIAPGQDAPPVGPRSMPDASPASPGSPVSGPAASPVSPTWRPAASPASPVSSPASPASSVSRSAASPASPTSSPAAFMDGSEVAERAFPATQEASTTLGPGRSEPADTDSVPAGSAPVSAAPAMGGRTSDPAETFLAERDDAVHAARSPESETSSAPNPPASLALPRADEAPMRLRPATLLDVPAASSLLDSATAAEAPASATEASVTSARASSGSTWANTTAMVESSVARPRPSAVAMDDAGTAPARPSAAAMGDASATRPIVPASSNRPQLASYPSPSPQRTDATGATSPAHATDGLGDDSPARPSPGDEVARLRQTEASLRGGTVSLHPVATPGSAGPGASLAPEHASSHVKGASAPYSPPALVSSPAGGHLRSRLPSPDTTAESQASSSQDEGTMVAKRGAAAEAGASAPVAAPTGASAVVVASRVAPGPAPRPASPHAGQAAPLYREAPDRDASAPASAALSHHDASEPDALPSGSVQPSSVIRPGLRQAPAARHEPAQEAGEDAAIRSAELARWTDVVDAAGISPARRVHGAELAASRTDRAAAHRMEEDRGEARAPARAAAPSSAADHAPRATPSSLSGVDDRARPRASSEQRTRTRSRRSTVAMPSRAGSSGPEVTRPQTTMHGNEPIRPSTIARGSISPERVHRDAGEPALPHPIAARAGNTTPTHEPRLRTTTPRREESISKSPPDHHTGANRDAGGAARRVPPAVEAPPRAAANQSHASTSQRPSALSRDALARSVESPSILAQRSAKPAAQSSPAVSRDTLARSVENPSPLAQRGASPAAQSSPAVSRDTLARSVENPSPLAQRGASPAAQSSPAVSRDTLARSVENPSTLAQRGAKPAAQSSPAVSRDTLARTVENPSPPAWKHAASTAKSPSTPARENTGHSARSTRLPSRETARHTAHGTPALPPSTIQYTPDSTPPRVRNAVPHAAQSPRILARNAVLHTARSPLTSSRMEMAGHENAGTPVPAARPEARVASMTTPAGRSHAGLPHTQSSRRPPAEAARGPVHAAPSPRIPVTTNASEPSVSPAPGLTRAMTRTSASGTEAGARPLAPGQPRLASPPALLAPGEHSSVAGSPIPDDRPAERAQPAGRRAARPERPPVLQPRAPRLPDAGRRPEHAGQRQDTTSEPIVRVRIGQVTVHAAPPPPAPTAARPRQPILSLSQYLRNREEARS